MSVARVLLSLQLRRYQLQCVRFLAAGVEPPSANIDELAEIGADLATLQDAEERN